MKRSLENISIPYLLAILGGVVSVTLGTSVLIGWYTHNVELIQVSAIFVPMQYNTALGFLLSGLGLLAVIGGARRAGMVSGIFVMLIGMLTLAEYIAGIDLNIDQLLMQHDITVQTSHPGRMAPNTALCFFLTGIALAMLSITERDHKSSVSIGVLGSLILALGTIALLGYILKLETAYGWGDLTRMAIHTAVGFMFLGMTVSCIAWHRSTLTFFNLPAWFPVPVGIGIATLMISLWMALELHEAEIMEKYPHPEDINFVNEAILVIGIVLAVALSLVAHLAQATRNNERKLKVINLKLAAEIDERIMVDEALRKNEEKFRNLTETTSDWIWEVDENAVYTYSSPKVHELLGYEADEIIGKTPFDLMPPDEAKRVADIFSSIVISRKPLSSLENTNLHKDGRLVVLESNAIPVFDKEGLFRGYRGIDRDITERKEAEQRIAKINRARVASSACNESLVRATDEMQLQKDICRIIVELGGYKMAWVGYAEHDEDKTVRPVAWDGHEAGFLDAVVFNWSDGDWGTSAVGRAIWSGERKLVGDINKDSTCERCRVEGIKRGYASLIALPLLEKSKPYGVLAIYSEEKNAFDDEEVRLLQELSSDLSYGVTALRVREQHNKAEKEIAYLAFHDSLTGLPNRAMFMQSLEFVLAQAERDNRAVAVLYIDLDQFKLVNDSLGHEAGDELLCLVTERLDKILRKNDIVARQGGDEFIVMMTDSGSHSIRGHDASTVNEFGLEAGNVAQKIIDSLAEPYQVKGNEAYVGASIGISLFPDDAKDAHTLLQHADSAMYHTKELNRGEYHFYSRDLSERQQHRLTLETRLHKAIERQEFVLWYQPVVDLRTGEIVGSEALIRWQPPGSKMVMPDEFLPVAEDSGMIISIGQWVAEEACRQLQSWQEKGWNYHVAINLSVRQFSQKTLVNRITQLTEAAGIPSSLLHLEVTESAMVNDPMRMEAILREFSSYGFNISLDDFGTGYSSLSRLIQLPIQVLKIDKSFVDGIPHSNDAQAIVTTIIELSENLGISCLAEGVETAAQWDYLSNLGCTYGQGYYFSRPVPAADIEKMFEHNQRWKLVMNEGG